MATLATQQIVPGGLTVTLVAAGAGGDKVRPGPNVYLEVNNASGGSLNVVIDDPNSRNPGSATSFDPDLTVAVGAGVRKKIGPLTAERFAAAADGLVAITYPGGVTSLTVGAYST